jgi:hypothetical protein
MIHCLSCDGEIRIGDPRPGAKITCPECGDVLEIVGTDPLEVDYPADDDWDDGSQNDQDWDEDEWDDQDEGW